MTRNDCIIRISSRRLLKWCLKCFLHDNGRKRVDLYLDVFNRFWLEPRLTGCCSTQVGGEDIDAGWGRSNTRNKLIIWNRKIKSSCTTTSYSCLIQSSMWGAFQKLYHWNSEKYHILDQVKIFTLKLKWHLSSINFSISTCKDSLTILYFP